jgi:hypothetical protein
MEALARSSARLVAFYASCTDNPQEALESLSRLLFRRSRKAPTNCCVY